MATAPFTTARSTDPAAAGAGHLAHSEAFLLALARAARQFHTYPASSPHCVDAIQQAVQALKATPDEHIVASVRPRLLVIDGVDVGRDTPIEHELARRLHDCRCQTLTIARAATSRDLALFCTELSATQNATTSALVDRLHGRGVDRIAVSGVFHPVLLDLDAPMALTGTGGDTAQSIVAGPPTGRVAHLYPPDKGWVRLDPGAPLQQATLSTLARLVDEPASLAQMLARLAGDANHTISAADALEQRCADVARLYTSLDPGTSRDRFAKLAGAVLTLDSHRRRRLLSTRVLPGLIDGQPEGELLREFPDVDLADALALLLDVETAAPELLTSALERLNLSTERHAQIAPLLEQRIHARDTRRSAMLDSALADRTQQLIHVVQGDASFQDFAAVDFSLDDDAEAAIAEANSTLHATHLVNTQMICVSQLIALCPNEDSVEPLLAHAVHLLGELERSNSIAELTLRMEALQRAAVHVHDARPAVASAIRKGIETFYTPPRVERLLAMYAADDDQRDTVRRLIAAAGASLTPAIVRTLQDRPDDMRVLQLAQDHAATFAPAIARLLEQLPVSQLVPALRILGQAGRGLESQIARQLTHQNEAVIRAAVAALASVGSHEAAEFVTRHLEQATTAAGTEDALWRFAPAVTVRCVRTLLRKRRFVVDRPEVAWRLLLRVDRTDASKLADALQPLASLRYRVWNPRLSRIGRTAAALLHG